MLGLSIATELRPYGIDVLVLHPSPVNSAFYNTPTTMDIVEFFKATAISPETIASAMFKNAGRTCLHEQGYLGVWLKLLLRLIDIVLFADLMRIFGGLLPDAKKFAPKKKE